MDDLSAHEAHEAVQSIIRDSAESDTVMVSDWVIVAAYEDFENSYNSESMNIHVVRSAGLSLHGMVGLLTVGQSTVDID